MLSEAELIEVKGDSKANHIQFTNNLK